MSLFNVFLFLDCVYFTYIEIKHFLFITHTHTHKKNIRSFIFLFFINNINYVIYFYYVDLGSFKMGFWNNYLKEKYESGGIVF